MKFAIAFWLLLSTLLSGVVAAQHYPDRSVRLIVPFPPGGGADLWGRVVAQRMSEAFGRPVVVDNRPGAGGSIGEEMIARADPDGYTFGSVSGYGTSAAIYKLSFDPVSDVQPVIAIGSSGFVVATNPATPIKTTAELIAFAKSNPGKLNYASSGTGAIVHLSTELLGLKAGIRMTHVAFKGGGPALAALLGNQVDLYLGSTPSTVLHIKAGKLRAIAVTTTGRVSALPEVPPVADAVPGYEALLVYGILAPKGVPAKIVDAWNSTINKSLQTPELKQRLTNDAVDAIGGAPSVFHEIIKRDVQQWREVVRAAKLNVSS